MSKQSNEDPNSSLVWIIWAALLISLGIYGAVAAFVEVDGSTDPEAMRTFLIALSVVAVSEIPVIFVLRRILFFNRLDRNDFDDEREVRQGYFTVSIITWAICESIAIYGFILTFLSGDFTYYPPFAAVGAAMMLYFRPKLDEQVEAFEEGRPDESVESEADESDGEGQHW